MTIVDTTRDPQRHVEGLPSPTKRDKRHSFPIAAILPYKT